MASSSAADLNTAHPATAIVGTYPSDILSVDVVRPEARRPYADSVHDRSKRQADESPNEVKQGQIIDSSTTLLLQQAANYASLANVENFKAVGGSGIGSSGSSGSSGSNKTKSKSSMDSQDHNVNFGLRSTTGGHLSSRNDHPRTVSEMRAAHPSAGATHSQRRSSKLDNHFRPEGPTESTLIPPTSLSSSSLASVPASLRSIAQNDTEICDPPRLSISSAEESSTSSEVKTPESVIGSTSWEAGEAAIAVDPSVHRAMRHSMGAARADVAGKDGNSPQRPHPFDSLSCGHSSPPLVDFSSGLAEAGFPHVAMATQRQARPQLVDAALALGQEKSDGLAAYTIDEERVQEGNEHPTDTDVADKDEPLIDVAMQGRAATVRKKRPTTLLRLPSARTDETARPSPPSTSPFAGHSTADKTPAATADNAYGLSQDPMDIAVVTKSGHGQLMRHLQAEEGMQQYPEPFAYLPAKSNVESNMSRSHQRATSMSDVLDDDSIGLIASPDSWRSLLPEHDPFFISKDALASKSSSRAPSMSGQGSNLCRSSDDDLAAVSGQRLGSLGGAPVLGQALAARLSASEKERRRLSSESMQSCFSLPGPTAAPICASSSASGTLYDLNGTFNSSGSRAAFAPLSYQYDQSTKSLASPSLRSPALGDDNVSSSPKSDSQHGLDMKASGSYFKHGTSAQSTARRHASFSTFDKGPQPSSSYSLRQSQQPLIHPDHTDRPRVLGNRFRQSISNSTVGSTLAGKSISQLTSAIPSSPSSSAMGDEGDRESWPSSRNSLQGMQGSLLTSLDPPQVIDPYSVDHRLAENLDRMGLRSDLFTGSPPGVLSTTSTSTTAILANVQNIPSDRRLFTSTTTVTTTTTLLTSPEAKDVAVLPRAPTMVSGGVQSDYERPDDGKLLKRTEGAPASQNIPDVDVSTLSSPTLPFLETRSAPLSAELKVETHPGHYTLKTILPGFQLEAITLAIKHHHELVIVADKWDESNGGHFERRVTFGNDADLRATRAKFDGTTLVVTVPRKGVVIC